MNVPIAPDDAHNQKLVSHVHPPGWINPEPASRYNLLVMGAGTAGLVSAIGAAGLGAKVALIEKHLMGGDCLNVGCVPSKALLRASRAFADVRDAKNFGITVPDGARVDFGKVMERMRRLRAQISANDSASRYKSLGVDVFIGEGKFTGPNTAEVDGKTLRFKKAVIATGARAIILPIPGLAESGCLTNETLFELTELPRRLLVIGAGPIGCEMAQAFARFGSQVTLLEAEHGILPREDRDAAEITRRSLERDGVEFICCVDIKKVDRRGNEKTVEFLSKHGDGAKNEKSFDAILLGVGRAPNVEGIGLESAGVKFDKRKGVQTNDYLQTTNPNIYSAGDAGFFYKFTHAADFTARIVIQNALFMGRKKASSLTIPWCTYTDPEIAHVGLYEKEAIEKGIPVKTFIQEMKEVDRAILDGEENGLLKIHVHEGSDKILGATLVARHAGDMISEITTAMHAGMGLGKLSQVIHPYPTQAETIRKTGDQYNRTRLKPPVKKILETWMRWVR